MKLCINCIHSYVEDDVRLDSVTLKEYKAPGNPEYALCRRVEGPVSLVTGKPKGRAYPFCSAERVSPCGTSARFYEEKETPVTQEEEEAWREVDSSCPACHQGSMLLVGTGKYFKCDTCGHHVYPNQEVL